MFRKWRHLTINCGPLLLKWKWQLTCFLPILRLCLPHLQRTCLQHPKLWNGSSGNRTPMGVSPPLRSVERPYEGKINQLIHIWTQTYSRDQTAASSFLMHTFSVPPSPSPSLIHTWTTALSSFHSHSPLLKAGPQHRQGSVSQSNIFVEYFPWENKPYFHPPTKIL